MIDDRRLDALFDPEPDQWGLRGDPLLWSDMRTAAAGVPCPDSDAELEQLVAGLFARITGAPLESGQVISVERYACGGMSSGQVSADFWIEEVLPLLRERLMGTS